MNSPSIATLDMPTAKGVDAEPQPAPEPRDQATELFTSLYEQLRRLARREVRRGGAADYVSTGTLVHEAWLQIREREALSFEDPARFLAYASRAMRGLVIDRVRARHAQKRGGKFVITSLDTEH